MSDKTEYISTTETAKLIRAALKKAFNGVKFSVRSKNYSGGSHISIGWIDGPTEREVNTVVGIYAGKSFDGMIDMAVGHKCWLLPDGNIEPAHSDGTEGSMGMISGYDYPKPCIGARLVAFMSSYIFPSRDTSAAFLHAVGQAVHVCTGWEIPEIKPHTVLSDGHDDGAYFVIESYGTGKTEPKFAEVAAHTSAYPAVTTATLNTGLRATYLRYDDEPEASEPEPVIEPAALPVPVVEVTIIVPGAMSKIGKFKPAANGKHSNAKFGGV